MEKFLTFLQERLVKNAYLVCVSLSICLLFLNLSADPDLFARMAVGRLIDTIGSLPLQDPFAFSPKKEIWVDHEWLSGVVFFYVFNKFGEVGLFVFKLLFFVATIFILFKAQQIVKDKKSFAVFLFSLILILDSNYIWSSTLRSHIFTFFFLSIYLYIFSNQFAGKAGRRLVYFLPLCMLAWCNLHGGFVVGLGLHGIVVLSRLKKGFLHNFLVWVVSVSVTALNPYGFKTYWSYIISAVSMPRPSIGEWHGLNIVDPSAFVSFLIIGISLHALFVKRREVFLYGLYFTALFFALRHVRHVAILNYIIFVFLPFALELLPVGKFVSEKFKKKLRLSTSLVLSSFVFAGLGYVAFLSFRLTYFKLDKSAYPEQAVDWLGQQGEGGNLLVDFNNGSFVIWSLFPKYKVSLDGRYEELYPDSTVELVSTALNCNLEGQRAALAQLSPDYILASHGSTCFSEKYERVHQDMKYAVYRAKKY